MTDFIIRLSRAELLHLRGVMSQRVHLAECDHPADVAIYDAVWETVRADDVLLREWWRGREHERRNPSSGLDRPTWRMTVDVDDDVPNWKRDALFERIADLAHAADLDDTDTVVKAVLCAPD